MIEESKIRLQELSHKWLKGTLTTVEQQEFDEWFNEQNQIPLVMPSDVAKSRDQHEQAILNRIKYATGIARQSKVVALWPRLAVAAAIAVVIFGGGLLYYANQSKPGTEQIATNQIISPGGNMAILTLANGQKISLSDASVGQVASQSGIKISKTANGQLVYDASDATIGNIIEYNTIEAPVGGQWQVKLPDGSLVFLNAMSKITYPTRFSGSERRVEMQGEAYFEIAHNKAMPFRVTSLGQTVEVLGTHFNIMAYADEKLIKTTLLEGAVKISGHGKSALLKPGQQSIVGGSNIKVSNAVDLEDVLAWKNGYFKFNESLESIMNKVSRWYNVEIEYQADLDKNQSFSGKILRSKNISSVLKIMELTEKVHFKIEGRKIVVMK